MGTYSVAEAKNRLPALIDKAIEGEEVVITRHGKPVAELRPRGQRNAASVQGDARMAVFTDQDPQGCRHNVSGTAQPDVRR